MSVVSSTAHCLFGGMNVSAALYTVFMDYEPSKTVKIGNIFSKVFYLSSSDLFQSRLSCFSGLLLCVVTFSLYNIWCRYFESLLWLGILACMASAGVLIAITEPDIFKLAL